ncbi:hypothetical protein [Tomitella fengzijianii]|uniref:hypothetical protein n=1 Tax=Tomitella fengzijianii TaxID=2597660 RepID=UPI00131EB431|nr:hypothetical protein [Tomitella fengzijianii]
MTDSTHYTTSDFTDDQKTEMVAHVAGQLAGHLDENYSASMMLAAIAGLADGDVLDDETFRRAISAAARHARRQRESGARNAEKLAAMMREAGAKNIGELFEINQAQQNGATD